MALPRNPYKIFGLDKIKLFVYIVLMSSSGFNVITNINNSNAFRRGVISIHEDIVETKEIGEAFKHIKKLQHNHQLLNVDYISSGEERESLKTYYNFNHYLDTVNEFSTLLHMEGEASKYKALEECVLYEINKE